MKKMKEELLKLIEEKSPGSKPLYLVIRGSHAYGTNVETSDTDFSGVFIQSLDDILGNKYLEQINDDKNDTVIYEVRRFLELLGKNNPTILELLNTPENCIIYKDPIFDEILNEKEKFITKMCANSFGGYAKMQIQKAKGQDKKQNWEKEKTERKEVLDFVYVIENEKTIPWKKWNENFYDEKFIGAVNVPNARDVYALFYDEIAALCFSERIEEKNRNDARDFRLKNNLPMGFGYKGLVKCEEGKSKSESNQLRLSSIPKGEQPICTVIYNKDAYTQHCKDYVSYETWLREKNEARWVDVKEHGQKIDGKNMMHCVRLIDMAREISEGKGINVFRENAKDLIDIRKGKVDLKSIVKKVEKDIIEIDELFKNSSLPDNIDPELINNLLIKIRKKIYNL